MQDTDGMTSVDDLGVRKRAVLGAHPTLGNTELIKERVVANLFCRWMLLYRCFLRTARRADVGPLREIGKEDSKPTKWRRIISIGRAADGKSAL